MAPEGVAVRIVAPFGRSELGEPLYVSASPGFRMGSSIGPPELV